jgi:hypothetical protein
MVVDDTGQLPAGQGAVEAFYRVVDAAYERRSVAVSSNLHPSGFDSICPQDSPPPPSTGSLFGPTGGAGPSQVPWSSACLVTMGVPLGIGRMASVAEGL